MTFSLIVETKHGGWVWNTTLYRQVGNQFPPLDDEPPSLSNYREGLRSPASTRISVQMPARAERRGGATRYHFMRCARLTSPVQSSCRLSIEQGSPVSKLVTSLHFTFYCQPSRLYRNGETSLSLGVSDRVTRPMTQMGKCRGVESLRVADAGDRYKTDHRRASQGNTESGNPHRGKIGQVPSR